MIVTAHKDCVVIERVVINKFVYTTSPYSYFRTPPNYHRVAPRIQLDTIRVEVPLTIEEMFRLGCSQRLQRQELNPLLQLSTGIFVIHGVPLAW